MALSIVDPVKGQFDPDTRDKASLARVLALAIFGAGSAVQRQTAQKQLADRPDFSVRAKTTDNAAASEVMDLTTEGVTFPAGKIRKIRFRSLAVTDNDQWVQEWEQEVLGGTTPVLIGTPQLVNARGIIAGAVVRYGLVRYHGTTSGATVTNGSDVDSGLSLGNFTGGVATLTHPIARATRRVVSAHFSEDAGTIADTRQLQVRSATSTTMTVNALDVQNATPALAAPTGTNNIDISLFILPPPSVALVMNSNNVEVHCGHDATDDVYHRVDVWVGKAEDAGLVAD